MNFDSEIETQIDRYLRREMSPEEILDFEVQIVNHPALMEELTLRRDIIIGIEAAERKALRRLLESAVQIDQDGNIMQGSDKRNVFIRHWALIVSGVILGLVLGYLLYYFVLN
jgi:hypothetical protein